MSDKLSFFAVVCDDNIDCAPGYKCDTSAGECYPRGKQVEMMMMNCCNHITSADMTFNIDCFQMTAWIMKTVPLASSVTNG